MSKMIRVSLITVLAIVFSLAGQPQPPAFTQQPSAGLELRLVHPEPADGLVVGITEEGETLYLGPVELSDRHLATIDLKSGPFDGSLMIEIALTEEGADRIRAVSSRHRGERLAVLVDGRVVAAPRIEDELGDRFVVRGTPDSVTTIARRLGLE